MITCELHQTTKIRDGGCAKKHCYVCGLLTKITRYQILIAKIRAQAAHGAMWVRDIIDKDMGDDLEAKFGPAVED